MSTKIKLIFSLPATDVKGFLNPGFLFGVRLDTPTSCSVSASPFYKQLDKKPISKYLSI